MTTQPSPAVEPRPKGGFWQRLARFMGWNRTSYALFGAFLLTCGVIVYVWWPLAEEYLSYFKGVEQWWLYIDWLLIGIWLVMSLLIMRHADIRRDLPIVLVGLGGGLVIESWGTQTELWTYYTMERPPLWIIPAWPVAALSVDRLVREVESRLPQWEDHWFAAAYWLIFPTFFALMFIFVMPTLGKSLTIAALVLSALLILTPKNYRMAVVIFVMGSALGYFLELWGTTRLCWTYYTGQQPPLFSVLAHGMAAVAFWRVVLLFEMFTGRATKRDPLPADG